MSVLREVYFHFGMFYVFKVSLENEAVYENGLH